MCGRLNVTDDPLTKIVTDVLGISFRTTSNCDLRPSESIEAVHFKQGKPEQLSLSWGFKPSWAKRPLINAQSETVAVKPTFREAFRFHRCVVPCTGWYEWLTTETGKKKKCAFTDPESQVVWMAGIYLHGESLVTLTAEPNKQCREYHHRMPLLLDEKHVGDWLGSIENARSLLNLPWTKNLVVDVVSMESHSRLR